MDGKFIGGDGVAVPVIVAPQEGAVIFAVVGKISVMIIFLITLGLALFIIRVFYGSENNAFLIDEGRVRDDAGLWDINRKIVSIAKKQNKL